MRWLQLLWLPCCCIGSFFCCRIGCLFRWLCFLNINRNLKARRRSTFFAGSEPIQMLRTTATAAPRFSNKLRAALKTPCSIGPHPSRSALGTFQLAIHHKGFYAAIFFFHQKTSILFFYTAQPTCKSTNYAGHGSYFHFTAICSICQYRSLRFVMIS